MTNHELTLMQDTIQEIYDRMGNEMLPDFIYRDYSSQMTGMYKLLNSIGYTADINCLGCVTIVKKDR